MVFKGFAYDGQKGYWSIKPNIRLIGFLGNRNNIGMFPVIGQLPKTKGQVKRDGAASSANVLVVVTFA